MSTSQIRPCIRCGVMRAGRTSTVLCGDCRSTMSAAERLIWSPTPKAVESDQRKVAA